MVFICNSYGFHISIFRQPQQYRTRIVARIEPDKESGCLGQIPPCALAALCLDTPHVMVWPVRLSVRTPGFQPGKTSSILVRATIMALFPLFNQLFHFAAHRLVPKKAPDGGPFKWFRASTPNRSIQADLLFAIKATSINQPTTRTGNIIRQGKNHRFADGKYRQEGHTDLVECNCCKPVHHRIRFFVSCCFKVVLPKIRGQTMTETGRNKFFV